MRSGLSDGAWLMQEASWISLDPLTSATLASMFCLVHHARLRDADIFPGWAWCLATLGEEQSSLIQTLMEILYGRVAITRQVFEPLVIEDANMTSPILDEFGSLQISRGRCDGHSLRAQNLAEYFLRDVDGRGLGQMLRREEPTRKSLRGVVHAMAAGHLA